MHHQKNCGIETGYVGKGRRERCGRRRTSLKKRKAWKKDHVDGDQNWWRLQGSSELLSQPVGASCGHCGCLGRIVFVKKDSDVLVMIVGHEPAQELATLHP